MGFGGVILMGSYVFSLLSLALYVVLKTKGGMREAKKWGPENLFPISQQRRSARTGRPAYRASHNGSPLSRTPLSHTQSGSFPSFPKLPKRGSSILEWDRQDKWVCKKLHDIEHVRHHERLYIIPTHTQESTNRPIYSHAIWSAVIVLSRMWASMIRKGKGLKKGLKSRHYQDYRPALYPVRASGLGGLGTSRFVR